MEKHPYGRYVPPPKLTRAEVEREFASGDPESIIHALYGAFFTVFPDREIGRRRGAPDQKREPANWVQDWCFKFVTHTDPGVRAKRPHVATPRLRK